MQTEYCWISVTKCSYFSNFSLCAVMILASPGTVSSKMLSVFLLLSIITMSGLSVVTMTSGGIVPPPCVWCIYRRKSTILNLGIKEYLRKFYSFFFVRKIFILLSYLSRRKKIRDGCYNIKYFSSFFLWKKKK